MITYQSFLKNELSARKRKNAAYSLRSFARDLDLSQSFLTQVLNGKRKLSDQSGLRVSMKLKLSSTQRKLFLKLVRLELTQDQMCQKILKEEIDGLLVKHPKFMVLSEDTFNIVSDWYYFGILELTSLKNFNSDPEWISKRLNVPVEEIKKSLQRLKRVGLLIEDPDGRLRKAEKNYLFANVPSAAIRKHHHQTLDLAQSALENQSPNEREFFTISLPVNVTKLTTAKRMIREFSERFMAEMEDSDPKSVYKLAVQFFRIDKESK